MKAFSPELLQDIAIQIRLDHESPNGLMSTRDFHAAKAIHAVADALDKIAQRRMEEELDESQKPLVLVVNNDNSIVCPLCSEQLFPPGPDDRTAYSEFEKVWRLHLYDQHPRRFNELMPKQS